MRHRLTILHRPIAMSIILALLFSGGCFGFKNRRQARVRETVLEPLPRFDDPDAFVFNDLPVRLYFHSQNPPATTEIIQPVRARSRVVANGRSCRDAGMEGLRKLQRIAVRYKANAVVNIRATWEAEQLGDDSSFGCFYNGEVYALIWEGALGRIPEPQAPPEGENGRSAGEIPEEEKPSAAIRKLNGLYYQGLITHEEFVEQKKKILEGLR